jgi:hypothetical protein
MAPNTVIQIKTKIKAPVLGKKKRIKKESSFYLLNIPEISPLFKQCPGPHSKNKQTNHVLPVALSELKLAKEVENITQIPPPFSKQKVEKGTKGEKNLRSQMARIQTILMWTSSCG